MAFAPSLLPVRKDRAAHSSLPRLKHFPLSSVNPQEPPQVDDASFVGPVKPAPILHDADATAFGWEELLGGGEDGSLVELQSASWLLDRSAFTIGAQTPARDRSRPEKLGRDAMTASGSEEGADDEDQVVLAQVPRPEASPADDAEAAQSALSPTSHPPLAFSPASDAFGRSPAEPVLAGASQISSTFQPSPIMGDAPSQPPERCASPAPPLPSPPFAATAGVTVSRDTIQSSENAPSSATDTASLTLRARPSLAPLVPRAPCSAISAEAEDTAPEIKLAGPTAMPCDSPMSADKPDTISSSQRPPEPRPSTDAVRARPAQSPVDLVAQTFALTRPAHILPKNHPAHRRRPLTAAVAATDSLAQAKKLPEQKGVKQVDDELKRKVRGAKADREKKVKERREKAEAEAARKAAARKEVKDREGSGKTRKRREEEVVDKQRREEKGDILDRGTSTGLCETVQPATQPATQPEPKQPPCAPAQFGCVPLPFLGSFTPTPTLAFDADMSLPAMGAPLDYAGKPESGDALTQVTSTPARPKKRHLTVEEPAAMPSASANLEVEINEVKRARRMTSAMPAFEMIETIKEEEENDAPLLPSALDIGPRRASRVFVAPTAARPVSITTGTATQTLPLNPSKGRAVRVSLLPPTADERIAAPLPPKSPSHSHRRASRVSFALAPGREAEIAEGASVSAAQVASTDRKERRRRRASRISLAPVDLGTSRNSLKQSQETRHVTQELMAPLKASMSRRASQVPPAAEEPSPSDVQPAPSLRCGGSAKPSEGDEMVRTRSHSPPLPLKGAHAPRPKPQLAQSIGGVTLPASFSFATLNNAREVEAERRRKEKERRDRLAEEVLAEKKRRREGVSSWAVQRAEDAKRPRLDTSLSASHAHPPPHSTSSAARTPAQSHPQSDEGAVARPPLSAPADSASHADLDEQPSAILNTPEDSSTVPLTQEALERNTRRSGRRPDLLRRVSRFLDSIGEATQVEEAEFAGEAGGADVRGEQSTTLASRATGPESTEAVPPVAPPPRAPSPTADPPSRAQPAVPRRRASRAPLSVMIADYNAQSASPVFVERLSSWKAREAHSQTSLAAKAGRVRAAFASTRAPPDMVAGREKENVAVPAATPSTRQVVVEKGVAAVLEKQIKERLEWSERQKKREEEVRRKRQQMREEEAARERNKLEQLRASLAARDRRPLVKAPPRRAARK